MLEPGAWSFNFISVNIEQNFIVGWQVHFACGPSRTKTEHPQPRGGWGRHHSLQQRPLLLEVNSSPGLEGIEMATGIDIADAMIQGIERKLKYQA